MCSRWRLGAGPADRAAQPDLFAVTLEMPWPGGSSLLALVGQRLPRLAAVSSPGELHPRALLEPGVSVSAYPAPTTHTGWFHPRRPVGKERRLPPRGGCQESPCTEL